MFLSRETSVLGFPAVGRRESFTRTTVRKVREDVLPVIGLDALRPIYFELVAVKTEASDTCSVRISKSEYLLFYLEVL